MTSSSYTKMLKQLNQKPWKKKRYLKHNKPKERKFGASSKRCIRCGNTHAHISSYGINMCRKCFRESAAKLGFRKYS